MSKRTLRMRCPLCGGCGSHLVVKTQEAEFRLDDEAQALIVRQTDRSPESLRYRSRWRKCAFCNRLFESVEMSGLFLTAMSTTIKELWAIRVNREERAAEADQLQDKVGELERRLTETRHDLEAAKEKLGRIVAFALQPLTKGRRRCVPLDAKQ